MTGMPPFSRTPRDPGRACRWGIHGVLEATRSLNINVAILIVITMFLLAGCDEVPVASRLGVLGTEEGEITLLYMACPEESVAEVALIDSHGELGDVDDTVLWLIQSKKGSKQSSFVVGETPPAFEGKVALTEAPPKETTITAQVRTLDGLTTATAFEPESLNAQIVVTVDGSVARDSFEKQAARSC